ncbi:MAG: TetR/AcrR family transcriptional regulator [Xenococcaceae cyanobacterium MO_167.B27]|nr:TetR/AcrR family transcriptional regulator [Xenococcaceae cyanobacterium MO_167.B27]
MKPKNNPLRRQPQQKRSQERVERILDAAAIVFDEVGFEAATTHAIASRADTAVGSLYQFFPDKLAIFNALELRHIDRVYVIWDKLLRPEIIQLPFPDFIHTMTREFQRLFEQPTSRIIFIQFFTSPSIFKNIDDSFTQKAIQFTAKLLQTRNPALSDKRSQLLAEICVHGINTLILLALRSNQSHSQEIFIEIEVLLKAYLKADIGDEVINNNSLQQWEKLAKFHKLNYRQSLILKYASNCQEITIKNCSAMFPDVSRRTLQRDLKVMLEQKLLLSQGNTDQRCYCLNSELVNL